MRTLSLILVLSCVCLSANEVEISSQGADWPPSTFVVENRYGDVTVLPTPENKFKGKLTVSVGGRLVTNPREEEQIIGVWTYLFSRPEDPKMPHKVLIDVRPRFYPEGATGSLIVYLPLHALRDLKVSAKGNISVSGFNVPADKRVFALSTGGKLSLHDNAMDRLVTSIGQFENGQGGDCRQIVAEYSEIEDLLRQRFNLPEMY